MMIKLFFKQLCSPLIYILFFAAILSIYLKEYFDGIIIILVILINAIVGSLQEFKAENALNALKKLTSPHCKIRKNDLIVNILTSELKVNDIVVLEEGDVIPCDGKIIQSIHLSFDESSINGESLPIEKYQNDIVYESSIVTSGRGEILVMKLGSDTEFGKIKKVLEGKHELTPLQLKLNNLSKILCIVILFLCLILFLLSYFRSFNLIETVINSLSCAVAIVPEGLLAIVTISLSTSVQKLIKINALVRNLSSIEVLGCVNIVCTDKTGTITNNKLSLEKIYQPGKNDKVIDCMVLCSNANLNKGDPTEVALIKYASKLVDVEEIRKNNTRIDEIPFSSESKKMEVICKKENKITSYIKGAYEEIIKLTNYYLDNEEIKPIIKIRKNIDKEVNKYYESSLRVLAFAYKEKEDWIFLGIVGERDTLKEGVKDAISELALAGVKTSIITGDSALTAKAIGKELMMYENNNNICLGEEVDKLSDEEFEKVNIFARVKPIDKMNIIKRYKKLNYVSLMSGDGVNDAPSLKEADIAIAMGSGSEVAKEVADIIILDDNFLTIKNALKLGRIIFDNIKKSILFLLSSNFGEIIIILLCVILNLPLALSALHILWVNLISDSLPGLVLGIDTPLSDVMKQKPRKKNISIFTDKGIELIVLYGICIAFITFAGFILLPLSEIINLNEFNILSLRKDIINQLNNPYILRKSRTIAFSILAISELFHMIGMSDNTISIFKIIKKKNYFMYAVLILGIILQICIVQIPFFNMVFKVEALSYIEWIWVIVFSLIPLLFHEIYL